MWGKNEKGREESKGMRQREIKEREAMKYVGEGSERREECRLREQKEKVEDNNVGESEKGREKSDKGGKERVGK